jgi:hypothetical protein
LIGLDLIIYKDIDSINVLPTIYPHNCLVTLVDLCFLKLKAENIFSRRFAEYGIISFSITEDSDVNNAYQKTWEAYTSSWQAETSDEKRAIFKESLDADCEYTDPLIKTKGWDELITYMLSFHHQVPGGYFVTKYFLAHNNQSIAKWDMKNSEHQIIGEGISYGKYNERGKLIVMTGFFETPGA